MTIREIVGFFLIWGLVSISSSSAATRYVNVSNATQAAPYTNWAMAATSIQPAIDAATSGDEILVAPGIYRISHFVEIPEAKTLILRSTLSREAVLDAQGLCPGVSIRGSGSVFEGFTVQNGVGGGITVGAICTVRDCLVRWNQAYGGGGIFFYYPGVVADSTIQSNLATYWGGGVAFNDTTGRLVRCVIRDNLASNYAGGVACQYGGTVSNCWIFNNRAIAGDGGGCHLSQGGELVNSVVAGNSAGNTGGGVFSSGPDLVFSPVINCTIVSNAAAIRAGGVEAGYNTRLLNDIIYFNAAPTNANLYNHNDYSIVSNCCVTPDFGWPNLTNAPAFVDAGAGDFRLATASFCIDAGTTNGAPGTDIDGNPRPRIGMPKVELPDPLPPQCDMGAYEYGFHFNDIRFTSSNTVQLRWDVQNQGIYKLDVETNGTLSAPWITNIVVFTNSGLMPGQFLVHTQTVVIADPPVPAQSSFRLRISRYFL